MQRKYNYVLHPLCCLLFAFYTMNCTLQCVKNLSSLLHLFTKLIEIGLRWIVPPSTSHADVALLRDDYVRVNAVPSLFLNTHINVENRQKMETLKERFLPVIIILS